ncbi:3-dehydroquinate synthase [Christensenellaceae bacterium OttesenSCG-928-K19]|nr:3-dehydroquinate synthase [Christensenellaceae bacterium OttesenSCG-928-K19]
MKVDICAKNGSYEIHIGKGLIENDFLSTYKNYAVVTDEAVYSLYGRRFEKEVCYILKPGEVSKNLREYENILNFMLQRNIGRHDALIALGGGVVGDIAGFAAATFKRGVKFVQIPTTLLAQVDSSVGGKVAVNLPDGKNMVGAFYQPSIVVADTNTLQTLDRRQYAAGMAEVIKYAYIADEQLYLHLREENYTVEKIVARCCKIKARYVEEDPFDQGIRMQLNYGHTIGHAIEAAEGYGSFLHGEAVALGMVLAAYVGEKLEVSPCGLEEDTKMLLRKNNLPFEVERDVLRKTFDYLQADKKVENGTVDFILIKKIGQAVLHKVTIKELIAILKEYPV